MSGVCLSPIGGVVCDTVLGAVKGAGAYNGSMMRLLLVLVAVFAAGLPLPAGAMGRAPAAKSAAVPDVGSALDSANASGGVSKGVSLAVSEGDSDGDSTASSWNVSPRVSHVAGSNVSPLDETCASCGKSILFGERCATCVVKERLPDKRACDSCEREIRVGSTCTRCLVAKLDAKLTRTCVDCEESVRIGTRCTACAAKHWKARLDQTRARLTELQGELGADLGGRLERGLALLDVTAAEASDDATSDTPGATPGEPADAMPQPFDPAALARDAEARKIADAEAGWRERALAFAKAQAESAGDAAAAAGRLAEHLALADRAAVALGAALEVADSVETTKEALATAGIQRTLDLTLPSPAGPVTLGDLATARLLSALPELAGTDLAEDPAAVLAALVVMDPLAFLMDFELVPAEGGPLTITEALAARGSQDPETALAVITLVEATGRLKRGENPTRALRDISRCLEILVPEEAAGAPGADAGRD